MTRFQIRLIFILLFGVQLAGGLDAQITADSIPGMQVDSLYDEGSDSSYFQAYNWLGEKIKLNRFYTDSVWNYWNVHMQTIGDRFYFHNGNNGSPARSAFFMPHTEIGWYFGLEQNDLYKIKAEDLVFADSDQTLAQLSYNQGGLQSNSQTNVLFATSFAKHAMLSLQYNRNHEAGLYPRQKTRTTSIGIGLVIHPTARWTISGQALSNNIIQQENGGIADSSLYNDPIYSDRSVYPVHFSDALLDDRARDFQFRTSYQLISTANAQKGLRIGLSANRALRNYLYNDLSDAIDSSAYKGYLTPRGTAHFGCIDRQWIFGAFGQWSYASSPTQSGVLDLSISQHVHRIHNDQKKVEIDQILLQTKWLHEFNASWKINTNFNFSFLDQGGDYLIDLASTYKLKKNIQFSGSIARIKKHPSYVQNQFFVLDKLIYNNSFSPTTTQTLSIGVTFNSLGLSLSIMQNWIDRFIYFNSDFEFNQMEENQQIFGAKLRFRKKLVFYLQTMIFIFSMRAATNF